jgi:cytochrome c oxidase subunit 2
MLIVLGLLAAGCDEFDSPQNTFSTRGEVADQQRDLFYLAMWPALVIMILVLGLVVFMMFRFARRKSTDPLPKQVHGNTALELGWTIAPAILLGIVAIPTLAAIVDLGRDANDEALTVEVEGIRWIWQFTYPELIGENGKPITTANEMHIPADREIGLRLTSPDVIHSFWVPRLAGKTDLIPGRVNHMWIKADEPGTYSGQCAEFCGSSKEGADGHATMRLTVVVHDLASWRVWLSEQGATERPPGAEDEQPADGEDEQPADGSEDEQPAAPEGEQATVQE